MNFNTFRKGGMCVEPFRLGILVGRFQTVHLGHVQMIRTALALCQRVAVFVGSSQESGTRMNPLPYEVRRQLLQNVFGDGLEVYPLPDIGVGNNAKWGDYVIENVRRCCGQYPDLLVSGKEARRIDWFDGVNSLRIAELYIPKSIQICASEMRELLCRDDYDAWKQYVPQQNRAMYPALRSYVLSAADHPETQSL